MFKARETDEITRKEQEEEKIKPQETHFVVCQEPEEEENQENVLSRKPRKEKTLERKEWLTLICC